MGSMATALTRRPRDRLWLFSDEYSPCTNTCNTNKSVHEHCSEIGSRTLPSSEQLAMWSPLSSILIWFTMTVCAGSSWLRTLLPWWSNKCTAPQWLPRQMNCKHQRDQYSMRSVTLVSYLGMHRDAAGRVFAQNVLQIISDAIVLQSRLHLLRGFLLFVTERVGILNTRKTSSFRQELHHKFNTFIIITEDQPWVKLRLLFSLLPKLLQILLSPYFTC